LRLAVGAALILLLALVWFERSVWRYCDDKSISLLWRGYCMKVLK